MNLKSALPLYVRLASSVVNLLFWASAVMRLCSATGRNMYAAYSAVMFIRIVALVLAHLSCLPMDMWLSGRGRGMSGEEFWVLKGAAR